MELNHIKYENHYYEPEYGEAYEYEEPEEFEELFFMGQETDEVRRNEPMATRKYWEEGLDESQINQLRSGMINTSDKQCYHCGNVGHI